MAYKDVVGLEADVTITLGGFNKKEKKDNPDFLEGYFLGTKKVPSTGKYGKPGKFDSIHYFQTKDGNIAVWGKTKLNEKLLLVPKGVMTEITYAGTVTTNNGDMHNYKLRQDPDNTIEVPEFTASRPVATEQAYDEYDAAGGDEEDTEENEAPEPVTLRTPSKESMAKVQALLKNNRAKN